jgi:excisionase family DNA binding protein
MENRHPEYLSLAELAIYSSLSRSYLRKCLQIGMPHYRVGRSIRVKRSDFDAWLDQFKAEGSTRYNRHKVALDEAIDEVRK